MQLICVDLSIKIYQEPSWIYKKAVKAFIDDFESSSLLLIIDYKIIVDKCLVAMCFNLHVYYIYTVCVQISTY